MGKAPITRRDWLLSAALQPWIRQATRSFWVLKLLAPQVVVVHPVGTARLHCSDGQRSWIIEGDRFLSVRPGAQQLHVTGPNDLPACLQLEVPGMLRRTYTGVLDLLGGSEVVRPVVTMSCEIAVGSIVGAELPVSEAPFAALAAQAVVSRSILLGSVRRRHAIADFCDTTHCQFLRAPAPTGSLAWHSASETAGLVLKQDGHWMSPRFSAACGGRTEGGLNGEDRYIPVVCESCAKERRSREGHGWGLCQRGAIVMARSGFTWQAILNRYLPNAAIIRR